MGKSWCVKTLPFLSVKRFKPIFTHFSYFPDILQTRIFWSEIDDHERESPPDPFSTQGFRLKRLKNVKIVFGQLFRHFKASAGCPMWFRLSGGFEMTISISVVSGAFFMSWLRLLFHSSTSFMCCLRLLSLSLLVRSRTLQSVSKWPLFSTTVGMWYPIIVPASISIGLLDRFVIWVEFRRPSCSARMMQFALFSSSVVSMLYFVFWWFAIFSVFSSNLHGACTVSFGAKNIGAIAKSVCFFSVFMIFSFLFGFLIIPHNRWINIRLIASSFIQSNCLIKATVWLSRFAWRYWWSRLLSPLLLMS